MAPDRVVRRNVAGPGVVNGTKYTQPYIYIYIYPLPAARLRPRAYNLWVAVRWYGLVVYELGRTGFVNGTICRAYFNCNVHPKT